MAGRWWPYAVACSVFSIDQCAKWAAQNLIGNGVRLSPFLALRYSENTGAAWSAFHGHATALAVLGTIVLVALFLWRRHFPSPLQKFSIALVFGGILGNTVDRIFSGHVVDFVDVSLRSHHWPTFNAADVGICIGALILLFTFQRKEQKA